MSPLCAPSSPVPQVLTEPDLVEASEAFEAAIRGGDRDVLRTLCQTKENEVRGGSSGRGSSGSSSSRASGGNGHKGDSRGRRWRGTKQRWRGSSHLCLAFGTDSLMH